MKFHRFNGILDGTTHANILSQLIVFVVYISKGFCKLPCDLTQIFTLHSLTHAKSQAKTHMHIQSQRHSHPRPCSYIGSIDHSKIVQTATGKIELVVSTRGLRSAILWVLRCENRTFNVALDRKYQ